MDKHTRKQFRANRKKKNKWKKIVRYFFFLLIVAGGLGSYIAYQALQAAQNSYSELERGEKSMLRDEVVQLSKHPVSLLLIGVEDYSTKGKNGRADSIIVATFNPELKTMKMLSIPRDTRVYIPSKDKKDKINHSYNDGKEATIETVEEFLDIPIDYYATVNFEGFKAIIDEIGGVEVDVPFDFWEYTDTYPRKKIYFKEGKQSLNGEEALAYARMRKRDPRGDFGRNDRQKEIIKAAFDSLMKPSNILKIDDIADHVGDNVETNVKVKEGIAFTVKYKDFGSNKIDTLTLEGSDDYNGTYYFVPNKDSVEKIQKELKKHLELPTNENQ
jgi:LCP family protein required for cell wall assembly